MQQQHPDTDTLDRYRAGLLDDSPREKASLEQHLATCDSCKASLDTWRQLDPGALGPDMAPEHLANDLHQARARALSTARRRRLPALAPYATAAALLVAVTVGVWTTQPGIDTTSGVTAELAQPVPDVYEDIDFYLWLASQEDDMRSEATTKYLV